jgi:CheY-like chemotaxis protein
MRALRVLIIDDDRDFAESLAMTLEGRDCEVTIAYTGEEALRVFPEHDFDLSFMDMRLPGKTGLECSTELRRVKPDARVVLMTGYGTEGLLDQARDAGIRAVFSKPLRMNDVFDTIEQARGGCVLVADDDPDFVLGLRTLLQERGKTVVIATDGGETIDRVLEDGVDVLILDMKMPIMNGLEVVKELHRKGRSVPTIVITGYRSEFAEEIASLKAFGVEHVLSKPFEPALLLERMDQVAQRG